ncbi:MAG: NUMOD3 domain-containing DNA-binding protein [Actinomycetes bacterium]|jgi:hypothetical protein
MSSSMGDVVTKQSISHAFYTYAHINKDTNKIFYIGKGAKNRYKSIARRNKYWHNIVKKYGFNAEILAYWASEKEAFDHEMLLISCFKDMGYKLANMTDGGEGISGYKHSQENKLKMSKKTLSKETKIKIGLAHLGMKRSDKAKQNMSNAQKSIVNRQRPPCSEETKKKISQKLKGRVISEESRLKMIATKLAKRGEK